MEPFKKSKDKTFLKCVKMEVTQLAVHAHKFLISVRLRCIVALP